MNHKQLLLLIVSLVIIFGIAVRTRTNKALVFPEILVTNENDQLDTGGLLEKTHPLTIASLKSGEYSGSELVIEQTLPSESAYDLSIASYKSAGLKIYALLTVPHGQRPDSGWPVIIFNHGFIPPTQYRTAERYVAYVDAFARNGYIVFKPDYRGHGNSEGLSAGGYGSNAYTIDVLNAVASIKRYDAADPNRIGMWGHSMGGHITLRTMVVTKDIKAGVIWAGVVGSYPDLLYNWRRRRPATSPLPGNVTGTRSWRQTLVRDYGEPEQNPEFWNSISATSYLTDISGPLQLHHGTADASVPLSFSLSLESRMKAVGKEVKLYTYEGDDHNLSTNLSLALRRSVEFFDAKIKKDNDKDNQN